MLLTRLSAVLVGLAVVATAVAGLAFWPKRYDTPDRARFDAFVAESAAYGDFVAYLDEQGVGEVVEPWHLWRQGTDWRSLGEPAFAAPPRDQWPAIVPTLTVVRDEIVPLVGPVEVVSGFRTERYNALAGGAPGSRHKWFEAVDVVPKEHWRRTALHGVLVPWWEQRGEAHAIGLGLYDGVRFHVDTWKYRTW